MIENIKEDIYYKLLQTKPFYNGWVDNNNYIHGTVTIKEGSTIRFIDHSFLNNDNFKLYPFYSYWRREHFKDFHVIEVLINDSLGWSDPLLIDKTDCTEELIIANGVKYEKQNT